MKPARIVVTRFGSLRKLATALGHTNHSTVQGWWDSGLIPAQHQGKVVEAAAAAGVAITTDELVHGNAEPEPDSAAERRAA